MKYSINRWNIKDNFDKLLKIDLLYQIIHSEKSEFTLKKDLILATQNFFHCEILNIIVIIFEYIGEHCSVYTQVTHHLRRNLIRYKTGKSLISCRET